jgi:hypothetical protein
VSTSQGSERLVERQVLPAALEYSLNYDVFFENGWKWVNGGKLPGLAPTNYTAGCKDPTTYGWSVRGSWMEGGQLIVYDYDQKRDNRCGEYTYAGVNLTINEWHALTIHVKLNQPANASNGIMSMYLNGTRVVHETSEWLRGDEQNISMITTFLFATFFGGSDATWSPNTTVYSRFDNFAVYPGLRVRNAPGQ